MKMKKKFLWRKVFSLMAIFCMLFSMGITVKADDKASPAVASAREGVLQINLVYVDQAGNQYVVETGSGFLVGTAAGATTVLTNYHVIALDDAQKAACSETFGVDFNNSSNINMQIQVVVKRDVVISASYVNGSEKTDFAILELSQAIHDRSPLKIADSDNAVETQEVYALGFPWVTSVVADDQVYTSDDVTITRGIIGKFQTINEIKYVLHDADLGYGNSGGPLVDADGNVVGINTMYAGDDANNYSYSVSINEVSDVMKSLGIPFETADGSGVTPNPEPTETQTEDLTDDTTEEPVPEPPAPPTPAPDPEPAPVETGMNMKLWIGIGAGILAVIVIIVIIAVAVSSSKKKKGQRAGQMPMGGAPMPGSGTPMGGAPMPNQRPVPPPAPSAPTPPFTPSGTMPMGGGAGETSVLGGGAGETSVLGGGSMQPSATLIRKKNGESAAIAKPNYSIGKERAKVDFCIPDNNSISRVHANIVCRGGVYFIIDNRSTNFTYVNGNKVNPGQEVKLNPGDKIRLADEEFDFRL